MSANKKLGLIIGLLVIVFIVIVAAAMIRMKKQAANGEVPLNPSTAQSPTEKKEAILRIAEKDAPLTSTERDQIYSLISGNQLDEYNLTKEERLKLINAINR